MARGGRPVIPVQNALESEKKALRDERRKIKLAQQLAEGKEVSEWERRGFSDEELKKAKTEDELKQWEDAIAAKEKQPESQIIDGLKDKLMAKRVCDHLQEVPLDEFDTTLRDRIVLMRRGEIPLSDEARELYKTITLPKKIVRLQHEDRIPITNPVPKQANGGYSEEE